MDGVMKKITKGKVGFFSTNYENHKSHPNRVKYLDEEIFLNYFSELELINIENRNDFELFRKNENGNLAFNRHNILHGGSFQYGTKLNGLKAMLLLKFISDLYHINIKMELKKR